MQISPSLGHPSSRPHSLTQNVVRRSALAAASLLLASTASGQISTGVPVNTGHHTLYSFANPERQIFLQLYPNGVAELDPVTNALSPPFVNPGFWPWFGTSFGLFVINEYEVSQDLNGNGQLGEYAVRAADLATGTVSDLGITMAGVDTYGAFAAFLVDELEESEDLNGDGAVQGRVLMVYDHDRGRLEVLQGTSPSDIHFLGDGDLLFSLRETGPGGPPTDHNGDGDVNDVAWFRHDPTTGTTTGVPLTGFLVNTLAHQIDHMRLAFVHMPEDGTDLNGDGDGTDTLPAIYDPVADAVQVVPIAGTWSLDGYRGGRVLPFRVSESSAGVDFNGDGDFLDVVCHTYDMTNGSVTNLGLAGTATAVDRGVVVLAVDESAQGATDLDGDGVVSGSVVHVLRTDDGAITNLLHPPGPSDVGGGFLGTLDYVYDVRADSIMAAPIGTAHVSWVTDSVFTYQVREYDAGVDLNGDGDQSDGILHLLDARSGVIENLGLSAAFSPLDNFGQFDGTRLFLQVGEQYQGNTDLNGDGDTLDTILHVVQLADSDGDGVLDSAERIFGGPDSLSVTAADEVFISGVAATGVTIESGGFRVEFPAGTAIDGASTELAVTFDPGPGFSWASVSGADLGGGTKSIEMPFDPDVPNPTVCIDDSPGAGSVTPTPGQCSGIRVAIPAVDGDSNVSGPYTVTRVSTSPPIIRVEGLSHTLLMTDVTVENAMVGLIDAVRSLNLQQGISNSLDAKLEAAESALSDLNQNNDHAAVNQLSAFIQAVEGQAGHQIPASIAAGLVLDAQAIIAAIDA